MRGRPHADAPRGAAPVPARRADRGARLARPRGRGARDAARPRSARGPRLGRQRLVAPPPGAERRDRAARRPDRSAGARAVARAGRGDRRRARRTRSSPKARPTCSPSSSRPTTLVWLVAGVGRVLPDRLFDVMMRQLDPPRGPRLRAPRPADRRPDRGAHRPRPARQPDAAHRLPGRARAAPHHLIPRLDRGRGPARRAGARRYRRPMETAPVESRSRAAARVTSPPRA